MPPRLACLSSRCVRWVEALERAKGAWVLRHDLFLVFNSSADPRIEPAHRNLSRLHGVRWKICNQKATATLKSNSLSSEATFASRAAPFGSF
jgi:hypothetical protein